MPEHSNYEITLERQNQANVINGVLKKHKASLVYYKNQYLLLPPKLISTIKEPLLDSEQLYLANGKIISGNLSGCLTIDPAKLEIFIKLLPDVEQVKSLQLLQSAELKYLLAERYGIELPCASRSP